MDALFVIIMIFSAFVLGAAGSYIMETKGRSQGLGFVLGFFLGALGMLILLGMENRLRRTSSQTDRSREANLPQLNPAVVQRVNQGILPRAGL